MPKPTAPKVPTAPKATAAGSVEDKVRGSADIPLSPEGIAEAERLGAALAKKGFGRRSDVISPGKLMRAQQTAAIIKKHCPGAKLLPPNPNLDTWSTGLEGMPTEQARGILAWMVQNPDMLAPEASGMSGTPPETFNQYRQRFLGQGLRPEMTEYLQQPNRRKLLVLHGRGIRITKAHIKKGLPDNLDIDIPEMLREDDHPGDIFRVAPGVGGRWEIKEVDLSKPKALKQGIFELRHTKTVWNKSSKTTAAQTPQTSTAKETPVVAAAPAASPRTPSPKPKEAARAIQAPVSDVLPPLAGPPDHAARGGVYAPRFMAAPPRLYPGPKSLPHFQSGGIVNDPASPTDYETDSGYYDPTDPYRQFKTSQIDLSNNYGGLDPRNMPIGSTAPQYYADNYPVATTGASLTAPGPWQQHEQAAAQAITGRDASGNPILDSNGQPITSVANVHPSWWRTAAAIGSSFLLGRRPVVANMLSNAILERDPRMQAARAASQDYNVSHQEANQERLNQSQQRLEAMARARNAAIIGYHQQAGDVNQQKADQGAIDKARAEYGEPVGLAPLQPPPAPGNTPAAAMPDANLPPLAGPGEQPVTPAIASAMKANQPAVGNTVAGWQQRTLRDPISKQPQTWQIPSAGEAARMAQDATAVPVNVPEDYRKQNNIPDRLPLALARQIEADYTKQLEGAANRDERSQRAQDHNDLMRVLGEGRNQDRAAARDDRQARDSDAIERQKDAALNAAGTWQQQQLNQIARTGQFGADYDAQVASINQQARQRKQQAMDAYTQAVRRRGGSAPDFTVGDDGSITEATPTAQPQPQASRPTKTAATKPAPTATPTPSLEGRRFPASRIPDLIERAKAAGVNLTPQQARQQMQSEGWTILENQ